MTRSPATDSPDRLTPRELAIILAALRHWQHTIDPQAKTTAKTYPQLEEVEPLSSAEIDELCERLNC